MSNDKTIVPDAIYSLRQEGRYFLYALELHNGKEAARVHRQLLAYLDVLKEGALSNKCNFSAHCRVVNVFAEPSCLRSVREKVRGDPAFEGRREAFQFSLLEDRQKPAG